MSATSFAQEVTSLNGGLLAEGVEIADLKEQSETLIRFANEILPIGQEQKISRKPGTRRTTRKTGRQ